MRYYYTDVLKAAWMAKVYGIRLGEYYKATYDEEYEKSEWHDRAVTGGAIETHLDGYNTGEWYVHPDCRELLNPQVGDLIIKRGNIRQLDKIGTVTHITKDGVCACYADYMDDAGAHEGSAVHMIFGKKAEILQRNGKAFFMPEVEE